MVTRINTHDMATKIEGWANGNPAYPGRHHSFTDLNSGIGVKATLVIGDERVFTESEVRAYEKDLMRALSDPGSFTERHREEKVIGQPFEETIPQWVSRARAIVRGRHGLSDHN